VLGAREPRRYDGRNGDDMTAHDASIRFTTFDTPIGCCGLAWRGRAIVGAQLPEGDEAATRARMQSRFPTAIESEPDDVVRDVVTRLRAVLDGGRDDLADIALDMTGIPVFHRRVYEIARTIAPGATLNYGELARRLGDAGAARAVGQALGRNPFAPIVPCHRILAAHGRLGGFSANGGIDLKRRMLELEGANAGSPVLPFGD
jgi:methylated-DNA-[protein]-cysteine S-methyltransferase